MIETVRCEIDGRTLIIETGKVAKQAAGAAVVQMGDTMVLATVCASDYTKEGQDFFPLTVEYRERLYAGGRIPGGFFKREGRLTEKETLSSRLIDRPIRPLFPENYFNEVQVFATVISADPQVEPDVHGITSASMALCLSPIPFREPLAGVRVGRKNGQFISFPSSVDLEESDIDMVVAGSESSILMVEGGGYEISESDMIAAIEFAHERIKKIVQLQKELISRCQKSKAAIASVDYDASLRESVQSMALEGLRQAFGINEKQARNHAIAQLKEKVIETLTADVADEKAKAQKAMAVAHWFEKIEYSEMRSMILNTGKRIGGRGPEDVRPITCEVGMLPRSHGSALFTRGETQALVTTTLGTKLDEQKIENFQGETFKSYMLHYNFPPFATGETKPIRGTSRREIGHGNLAERSLAPILPVVDMFPYTIRVVSDILESNGSSSMATICGGSLSLMDAGVPVKTAVAGIAMGLIKEGDRVAILTDILGDEDHLGDMDFKVAGTRDGITGFQMDIKISGITSDLMQKALEQARRARLHVLELMNKAIDKPRSSISPHAPRIFSLKIAVDKIGALIGPGGKVIRGIQDQTGATITVEDDGTVLIYSTEAKSGEAAKAAVEEITAEAEVGKTYTGKVVTITNFGAFVEFMPGHEGLVHISELEHHRVNKVEDVVKMGDEVTVKLLSVDSEGRYKLSRKAILPKPA